MHTRQLFEQKAYEHPVYHLRSHPLLFIKSVFVFLLLAVIPYGLYRVFLATYPTLFETGLLAALLTLGASIYYLAIWLFLFSELVDYILSVWIVTNDRIVSIEQHGLFGRTVAELDLYKVQDVTSEVHGTVATLLNYGDVFIQTAGEKERFVFEKVPNPHHIRQGIIDLVADDRKTHEKEFAEIAVQGNAA